MDPVTMISDLYMDIFNEFRNMDEILTNDQIIELMKVMAIQDLRQTIHECFARTNEMPSISEALIMAARELSQ